MKISEMKETLGDILLVSVEDGECDVLGQFEEGETVHDAIRRAVEWMNAESDGVEPWPEKPETDAGWLPDGITIFHPNGFQAIISVLDSGWKIENLYVPNDDAATDENWKALTANECMELVLDQIELGFIDPQTGAEEL